jgi:hypothetical protein
MRLIQCAMSHRGSARWLKLSKKRPFLRHHPTGPILVPDPAQKLSPSISAQLVVGRAVLGRDEDGRTS